jgi:hypothetical protein
MRVEDIMEADVEVADPSTPAHAAWDRMRRHGLRMFAVIDTTGIVGLVTRKQLGGRGGALNHRDRTLGDFVRSDVVSTTPDCSLAELRHCSTDVSRAAFLSFKARGWLAYSRSHNSSNGCRIRGTALASAAYIARTASVGLLRLAAASCERTGWGCLRPCAILRLVQHERRRPRGAS